MIVIMNYNEVNTKAAQMLSSLHEDEQVVEFYLLTPQKDVSDTHLILLDLTADPEYQMMLTSKYLIEKLQKNEILDKIKTIDLYMSDVSPESRLSGLGQEMADLVYNTYHKEISIRVMTNPHFTYTLVLPPKATEETWKIVGIEVDEEAEKKMEKMKGIEAFHQLENKRLLWEGRTNQLKDYMQTQGQELQPLNILYRRMMGK